MHIRPAISSDISGLVQLDHGYSTDHVWQMAYQNDGGRVSAQFQEVRLPRPMRVRYPRDAELLIDHWTEKAVVLVAEDDDERSGYLTIENGTAPDSAWVTDLVVDLRSRRQGHASSLIRAARTWASERGYAILYLEMQSKNYPAIQFARKHSFIFSGYSDRYYPGGDIALFFVLPL
ncbi:MAG: GNAT family N-acetyltransferase [Anaerolineales bacterium]